MLIIITALLSALLYTILMFGIMSVECFLVTTMNKETISPSAALLLRVICVLLGFSYVAIACIFFEYIFGNMSCGGNYILEPYEHSVTHDNRAPESTWERRLLLCQYAPRINQQKLIYNLTIVRGVEGSHCTK
jgi:hypothetical protein